MRKFLTETLPDGTREDWYSDEAGNITRSVTSPDLEPFFDAVKAVEPRGENQFYMGSVPMTLASAWAAEWGVKVGSKEFLEKARKRLSRDSDFSRLSSGIRV